MTCEALGIPYANARSADELTDADRYVAIAISEAKRLYQDAQQKRDAR